MPRKPPRTGARPKGTRPQGDKTPRGQDPRRAATSHEDTFSGMHAASPRRAGPPRSHHNSLFTLQPAPRAGCPARCLLHLLRTSHPPAPYAGGGGERDRTDDLLLAKQALSQLSYTPVSSGMVGQGGFEPPTSRLSSARSNQLSY